jgi:hypothetical protein
VFVGHEVKAVDGEAKMVEAVIRGCLGELFGAVIIGGPARAFCERVFGATVINQSRVDSDVKIREPLTVDVIIREPLTVDVIIREPLTVESDQSRCSDVRTVES